ncbi:hypothetical protein MRX96_037996 [Rhipicephalus microplus]
MMLNPFRFVLQAVTVLLGTSSWPHYYASQTTHAHRLVAFGCVSSSEGDNFALNGLCLLRSNDSTWLLSLVTSPHVGESPAIRAPAERDFTSGLGSSIPGMMLNPFRFVLQWVRHQNHIRNDNTGIATAFELPFSERQQEVATQLPTCDSSHDVDSSLTAQSEPANTANAPSERRYPQRQRHPPDRFVP